MAASFNPPAETLRAFARNQTDEVQGLEEQAARRGLDPRVGAGAGPINVAGRRRNERMAGAREAATERAKKERIGVMRAAGQQERNMKERAYRTKEAIHRKNSQQVARNLVRGFAERHRNNKEDKRVADGMRRGNVRGLIRDAMKMAQEAQQAPVNVQGSMYDDPEIARLARRYGDSYARRAEQLRDEQAAATNYLNVMRENQAANRAAEMGEQQVMQGQLKTQGMVAQYGTPEQVADTFGPGAVRDAQGNIVNPGTQGPQPVGMDQFGQPTQQMVDPSGAFTGQTAGVPGGQQMSAQAAQGITTEQKSAAPGVQELQHKMQVVEQMNLPPDQKRQLVERLLGIDKPSAEDEARAAKYRAAQEVAKTDPGAAAKMIEGAGTKKVSRQEFLEKMVASNPRFATVEDLLKAAESNPKLKARLDELAAQHVTE